MKKKIYFMALMSAMFVFISGCQKGDTGPQGPAGADGSANVSSQTFAVNSWLSNSSSWYIQLNIPSLNSYANTTAAVEVFFSTNSGLNWAALPYTQQNTIDYFMEFVTGESLVEVDWIYNGTTIGTDPNTYYGTAVQLKVVVIPPTMKKPNVDYNNYVSLKAAYNLKD